MRTLKDIIFNKSNDTDSSILRKLIFKPILNIRSGLRNVKFKPILASTLHGIKFKPILESITNTIKLIPEIVVYYDNVRFKPILQLYKEYIEFKPVLDIIKTGSYKAIFNIYEYADPTYNAVFTIYKSEDCDDEFIALNC